MTKKPKADKPLAQCITEGLNPNADAGGSIPPMQNEEAWAGGILNRLSGKNRPIFKMSPGQTKMIRMPEIPIQEICKDDDPWKRAKDTKLIRFGYKEAGEILEPGVNFFVLALEHLGAQPRLSCEGHPKGFYITFDATFELARKISQTGYFTVEIWNESWTMRIASQNHMSSFKEKEKRRILKHAGIAWRQDLLSMPEG